MAARPFASAVVKVPMLSLAPRPYTVPSRLSRPWRIVPTKRKPDAICLHCRAQRTYSQLPASTSSSVSSSATDTQSNGSAVPKQPSSSSPTPGATLLFNTYMDTLQSRLLLASQRLNDLTGYTAIEAIRTQNTHLELSLAAAQQTLRDARAAYKSINAKRASTSREVTTLLARKDSWTPSDLERFTTLYRQDHEVEAEVLSASTALTEAEAAEAQLNQALNSGILKRYHEEQIWSDRIRRQSTWGTWGLMGVNVLLFLVLQFVAEPWKRNRLMRGIAAEEREALEAVRMELRNVREALAAMREIEAREMTEKEQGQGARKDEGLAGVAVKESAAPVGSGAGEMVHWRDALLLNSGQWRTAARDLYDGRYTRDASVVMLESIALSAVIASGALVIALHR